MLTIGMANAQNKTQPAKTSVAAFLNAIPDDDRRRDCKAIAKLLKTVSGKRPALWGTSIVGYGTYHYTYASGREGDSLRIGFSPRKQDITIYIMPGYTDYGSILSKLGKHKKGKSCLYIKRLSDVDMKVLERLVRAGWKDMQKRYPE